MNQNVFALDIISRKVRYFFTDFLIVGFMYLLPTITHFTSIPFYLFEPMRFAVVFAIIFTNRNNSLIIALTIPLISILISSHPHLAKGLLISSELLINVVLYYYLIHRLNNIFIVMFISILISKSFYYFSKFFFINIGLISGDLISTPIWIQYLVVLAVSICAAILFKNKAK